MQPLTYQIPGHISPMVTVPTIAKRKEEVHGRLLLSNTPTAGVPTMCPETQQAPATVCRIALASPTKNVVTRTKIFTSMLRWMASHPVLREARSPPLPRLHLPSNHNNHNHNRNNLLLVPHLFISPTLPPSLSLVNLPQGLPWLYVHNYKLSVFDLLVVCSTSCTSGNEHCDAESRDCREDSHCRAGPYFLILFVLH